MATQKQLMILLSQQGRINQRKELIFEFTNGRTSSVRDLTQYEIDNLCKHFQAIQNSEQKHLDKKRKRLIAAIFGTFKLMNKEVSLEYVKSIACRAAKVEDFNKIPSNRLDSIYNSFLKAQKDLKFSGRIVDSFIMEQQSYN